MGSINLFCVIIPEVNYTYAYLEEVIYYNRYFTGLSRNYKNLLI
ncbi:hypothetical protein SAMN05660226_03983 [Parapedobacter luteus]|uniref:Uncharacterized protein n=1 Tax=Parapedobacter luteus TaxID=623280 RepID=A0A1T5FFT8_9SPHI|nr:hypothetical protein SAMN05660226_03983 [Parapedobacter luteus]